MPKLTLEDSVESANEQAEATAILQYTAEEPTDIAPDVSIHEAGDEYSWSPTTMGCPS